MKTLKGALFMSIKPKVDIDVLLYMFQEYEKGVSFQYLIDTLQLDINVNTLYPKYKYYKTHGIETLLTQKQYNHYSKELKLKVVNEYLNSNQSTQDIAIKYNIRSSTQVKNWIKMYTVGKEINFTIPQNKVTAFVGPSGSGKSTIFNSIEKMYDIDNGKIYIGNSLLSDLDLLSWRKNLGYVMQDNSMMSGTIRDNILYGLEDQEIKDDYLDYYCKLA
ncbi:ATP-binding cassette domain-containing protein, partial [Staphylococcus aureus]|uniref:ATP-binding cassette domain-containing protein n=1 Tax=Staphylococcus aureus TaxID=1280 RepID=UPI001CDBDD32